MFCKLILSLCIFFGVKVILSSPILNPNEDPKNYEMQILNDESFKKMVTQNNRHDDWYIMFDSDNCVHARRSRPLWEEVRQKFIGKVHLARIYVNDSSSYTTSRFNIVELPQYVLIKQDMWYDYNLRPTLKNFINFFETPEYYIKGNEISRNESEKHPQIFDILKEYIWFLDHIPHFNVISYVVGLTIYKAMHIVIAVSFCKLDLETDSSSKKTSQSKLWSIVIFFWWSFVDWALYTILYFNFRLDWYFIYSN